MAATSLNSAGMFSSPSAESRHKSGDGAVIGPLNLGWKQASRYLAMTLVIKDTVAAFTLSLTGLVGAGASSPVSFDPALHFASLFDIPLS